MKFSRKPLIAVTLLGASCAVSNAAVLYTMAGPVTVNEMTSYVPPGFNLSRGANATGTLYFKYTVTTASNFTTENYYAGMSFFEGSNEHLGVGNGWDQSAYSAFVTAVGNVDLKSANPEPGQTYQLVRSTDVTTLVLRVDYKSGANDDVKVWLNPDLSRTEAAQSDALTTYFAANASFNTIYLREGGGGAGWTYSNFSIAESPTDAGFFAVPETSTALVGPLCLMGLLRRRR